MQLQQCNNVQVFKNKGNWQYLASTHTHTHTEREREREYCELWKPDFINVHKLHHEII